jgi:hypothetical protein
MIVLLVNAMFFIRIVIYVDDVKQISLLAVLKYRVVVLTSHTFQYC